MPEVHKDYTEMELVEKPTIQLFDELGWETINAEDETLGPDSMLVRERQDEIRLQPKLVRLGQVRP